MSELGYDSNWSKRTLQRNRGCLRGVEMQRHLGVYRHSATPRELSQSVKVVFYLYCWSEGLLVHLGDDVAMMSVPHLRLRALSLALDVVVSHLHLLPGQRNVG